MKAKSPVTNQGLVDNSATPDSIGSGRPRSDPTGEIRWRIITTSELEQLRNSIHVMHTAACGRFHEDEIRILEIIDEVERRGR